ncbi:MAG: 16S rRNA (cytosine(1402)-N(4))-methyltransferase RsmH [bacterium]
MHISVLLNESIQGLELKDGDIVFDGTFGGGGHTRAMLAFGKDIKIIATDLDLDAINKGQELVSEYEGRLILENDNFGNISKILASHKLAGVDKILLDLGWSSDQLEYGGRGLSFLKDEPLLMTLKKEAVESDVTAEDIVNHWAEDSIADILFGFGDEKHSRRIAKAIIDVRKVKPLKTTAELVEVISKAVPPSYRFGKIHPATRTFQALRIAVNRELETLEEVLEEGWKVLNKGGRIAVISFHSLEDRIVKQFFRKLALEESAKILTKRPIIATKEEIGMNPRSRSAKLRIIQKI